MKHLKNTTTVYDAGGLILVWIFFGLPLGIIFDYFWNLLVLTLALPRLPKGSFSNPASNATVAPRIGEVTKNQRLLYCFFVTILGGLIDWAYFEMTWYVGMGTRTQVWEPAMGMALQFILLLVPMIMLGLVNFALSYSYLKLERKQAVILGVLMAFFTAPWLLPILPHTLGWVG